MIRALVLVVVFAALIARPALPCRAQSDPDLQTFFRENIGLTPDQIAAIRSGQPITKALPSRVPAAVFLFGAVYIHAAPESYLQFARDFDRLRSLPSCLALGVFSNPPQLSDLEGFSFDQEDVQALKSCEPGDCLILSHAKAPPEQLYASHYFQTALDLSFCVRGSDGPKQPGFYLIGHGFRAGWSDRCQGIDRSKGRGGPVGLGFTRCTHDHQEHAGR